MDFNVENLVEYLKPLSKENILKINKKLIFDCGETIGVSTPDLHKLAKQFIVDGSYKSVLELPHNLYHEIDILQGLIIGYVKIPFENKLQYLDNFVPSIKNWAVCDSTVCNLKPKQADLSKLYNYATGLLSSEIDFEARFGVVVLMRYFSEKYNEILPLLKNINYGKNYYVDMAVAWLLAEYMAKTIKLGFDCLETNPVLVYIKSENSLNEFTVKKAYQKMRESYRIPQDWKVYLK